MFSEQTLKILELASQGGVWLALVATNMLTRKNKWGNVVGLIGQPFWLFTTFRKEQWGIFLLSILYTLNYIYGICKWFGKEKQELTHKDGS